VLCQRTGFMAIYCHVLNGNQLVQFSGCPQFLWESMCKQTFNMLTQVEVIFEVLNTYETCVYFNTSPLLTVIINSAIMKHL
jgi:hypothetical protein